MHDIEMDKVCDECALLAEGRRGMQS
jgi:hypothetical protein